MEYPAHATEPAKLIFDFPRAESAAHRVDGNVHQKKLLVHRNYGFGRRSLRAIRCSRLCSSEIHLAGALIFPGKPPLKSSLAFVFCVGSGGLLHHRHQANWIYRRSTNYLSVRFKQKLRCYGLEAEIFSITFRTSCGPSSADFSGRAAQALFGMRSALR